MLYKVCVHGSHVVLALGVVFIDPVQSGDEDRMVKDTYFVVVSSGLCILWRHGLL